ncbi:hypothetical protein [Streptomyces sp. NPDC002845]
MTETDTGEGKLYLVTGIDLFSRRLLGCAMGLATTPPWSSPPCTWPPRPAAGMSAV